MRFDSSNASKDGVRNAVRRRLHLVVVAATCALVGLTVAQATVSSAQEDDQGRYSQFGLLAERHGAPPSAWERDTLHSDLGKQGLQIDASSIRRVAQETFYSRATRGECLAILVNTARGPVIGATCASADALDQRGMPLSLDIREADGSVTSRSAEVDAASGAAPQDPSGMLHVTTEVRDE